MPFRSSISWIKTRELLGVAGAGQVEIPEITKRLGCADVFLDFKRQPAHPIGSHPHTRPPLLPFSSRWIWRIEQADICPKQESHHWCTYIFIYVQHICPKQESGLFFYWGMRSSSSALLKNLQVSEIKWSNRYPFEQVRSWHHIHGSWPPI